jgi:hypothetical protein
LYVTLETLRRRSDFWNSAAGGPGWIRTNDQGIMSPLL